uniref:Uncharacterized protein n=1 Tax=Ananas comosus var. bracteatus TaxID=296719 RepID=A0A6V7Q6U9_ANACO|nr:unnamed protein product [Ananas comosus var. bracteatus]
MFKIRELDFIQNRPRVVLVSFGKAKDVKITKSALEKSPRGQIVQNLHWSKIALGDRSLAGRTGPIGWWLRGSLRQPVPGRERPVPERDPSEKSQNLAKSRNPSSREPVSQEGTGLPGTGLSGKDRFPNA